MAQNLPDAGRTLQQNQPPVLQAPEQPRGFELPTPAADPAPPGGVSVTITALEFSGNTMFSQAQLETVIQGAVGQAFDLAGLQSLANQISAYYRAHGYPFASAFIPTQSMARGVLRIEVIEGQYGKVYVTGDAALAPQIQDFLSELKPGKVIETGVLERAAFNLFDLPGINIEPFIRPGDETGTGDLEVNVQRIEKFNGEIAIDNFGNRYTGPNRLRVNASLNSPIMAGDQIKFGALNSDRDMGLATLDYSAPIEGSGLRWQLGYIRTSYKLGKEFAASDASGVAYVSTLGLKYPLLRSRRANAYISAIWQNKELNDIQGAASSSTTKYSQSIPINLNFDIRDSLLGGALSYGSMSYTAGSLNLDSGLRSADASTAQSQGDFGKLNLDVARIQSLSTKVNLFGRVSAQWATKNLDSSEKFGLGGSSGVRAYPSGEGFGDQGWFAQWELRYAIGAYTPYLFYDTGEIMTNTRPWSNNANQRTLSGGGLGLRWQRDRWNVDAVVAWQDQGGKSTSDPSASDSLFWVTLVRKF